MILFNSFDGDTWGSQPPMHKEQPPGVPERKVQRYVLIILMCSVICVFQKRNPYGDDFAAAYTPPMVNSNPIFVWSS